MPATVPLQRALISVSDKTGLISLAQDLTARGIEIISTGGTFSALNAAGIAAIEISDYTGFPEMMAGRVKTLHPKIHGGILGRRSLDEAVMAEHLIAPIDLVVVNLYPFAEVTAKADCDLTTAIENIDIGGPAMLRSAAKNHAYVGVVVNPADYAQVVSEIDQLGGLTQRTRFNLALKAFEHTARYDGMIAQYLGGISLSPEGTPSAERVVFPKTWNQQWHRKEVLRYGENPHQNAAFYVQPDAQEPSVATATQLQGKALSFNNIADTDAALECVKGFTDPSCVIVKHANPCGVASAGSLLEAYELAYRTDPTSAFGGIIAFNQPLDQSTAEAILDRQFVEVLIAPEVSESAQTVLAQKPNIRVLRCGQWQGRHAQFHLQPVTDGVLIQDRDLGTVDTTQLKVVSARQPSAAEWHDLRFAWQVCQAVKSNAIVYAHQQATVGIGAGQMSRVYSARIAAIKAEDEGLTVAGSVMASDAFFPFRDGLDQAAAVGIRAVIQPGGSMRDDEVIAAANEHDMAMVFTGRRHFRH